LENNKFRPLIKFPTIEHCSFMAGLIKSRTIFKQFINILKKQAGVFFHKCPYHLEHSMRNITFDSSFFMLSPGGIYRFAYNSSDELDDNIWSFNITLKTWY